jgi:hypothetical protein
MLTLSRVGAIMKGAVLLCAGVEGARERWMRRSYGVSCNPVFDPSSHPEDRKCTSLDGLLRCSFVMHWFTRVVIKVDDIN